MKSRLQALTLGVLIGTFCLPPARAQASFRRQAVGSRTESGSLKKRLSGIAQHLDPRKLADHFLKSRDARNNLARAISRRFGHGATLGQVLGPRRVHDLAVLIAAGGKRSVTAIATALSALAATAILSSPHAVFALSQGGDPTSDPRVQIAVYGALFVALVYVCKKFWDLV